MDEQAEYRRIRQGLEEILPLIAERSGQHEQERRGSAEVYEALRAQGLFGLLGPRALGGMEVSPTTAYAIWEEVARHDSGTSWNLSQSNGGLFLCAGLGPSGIEKVFSGGTIPVFAGAAFPQGQGRRDSGGFRVTGRVRYVSGCHGADWLFMPFLVEDEGAGDDSADRRPQVMMGLFRPEDAQIHDTWRTMGMCGTGSHDVSVSDIFIPDDLAMAMSAEPARNAPFDGPLYRLGPWPIVHGEAVTALGIAAAAVDRLVDLAGDKRPANSSALLRDREAVQANLARARASVEAARSYLHRATGDAYREAQASGALSAGAKQSLQLAACHVTEASAKAVGLVFESAGSSAVWSGSGFERSFRDIHVITQHAQLAAPRYTSVGRVMLGLPPDTPMLN